MGEGHAPSQSSLGGVKVIWTASVVLVEGLWVSAATVTGVSPACLPVGTVMDHLPGPGSGRRMLAEGNAAATNAGSSTYFHTGADRL